MLIPKVKRGLVKSVKKKVTEKYINIVSMEEYADTVIACQVRRYYML